MEGTDGIAPPPAGRSVLLWTALSVIRQSYHSFNWIRAPIVTFSGCCEGSFVVVREDDVRNGLL